MPSPIYAVHYDEGFDDGVRSRDKYWVSRVQKIIEKIESSNDETFILVKVIKNELEELLK